VTEGHPPPIDIPAAVLRPAALQRVPVSRSVDCADDRDSGIAFERVPGERADPVCCPDPRHRRRAFVPINTTEDP